MICLLQCLLEMSIQRLYTGGNYENLILRLLVVDTLRRFIFDTIVMAGMSLLRV